MTGFKKKKIIYHLLSWLLLSFLPGFSTVSDSQGPTEFTSTPMNFSEDSNSQSSGTTTPAKRLKTD